jgi:hypothetical protein
LVNTQGPLSKSTYTGSFANADSTILIVNNSVALTEEVMFTGFSFIITGDVVVVGDLPAENCIVGFTNLNNEIKTKQDLIEDGDILLLNFKSAIFIK